MHAGHHMMEIGLLSYFLLGLTTSWHCIGMCGPLSSVIMQFKKDEHLRVISFYHLGRLLSYSLVGFIIASLGFSLKIYIPKNIILAFIFIPLIIYGFNLTRFLPQGLTKKITQPINTLSQQSNYPSLILGLLTPLIPCGILWMAFSGTLSAPNPFYGAGMMASFQIGTIPLLFLSQWGMLKLTKNSKVEIILRVIAVLGVALLVWMQMGGHHHHH